MDLMRVMMKQELSNTHNIEILAYISGQTLYSINSLVQSVEKINDNVSKINSKIPEPGPGPIPPKPPVPPVPPVPPKPVPPKPKPIIDGSIKLFWCQCHSHYVRFCPKYDCYHCPDNPNANVIWKKVDFENDSDS